MNKFLDIFYETSSGKQNSTKELSTVYHTNEKSHPHHKSVTQFDVRAIIDLQKKSTKILQ